MPRESWPNARLSSAIHKPLLSVGQFEGPAAIPYVYLRRPAERTGASLGPLATPVLVDVGTSTGATAFIGMARETLGGIDILIANAGGPPAGTFEQTPFEAYAPALELSLLSSIALCQAVVPEIRAQKWGGIVAITSPLRIDRTAIQTLESTRRVTSSGCPQQRVGWQVFCEPRGRQRTNHPQIPSPRTPPTTLVNVLRG